MLRVVSIVSCSSLTYNAALNRPAYQVSVYSNRHGYFPANLANDGSHQTDIHYGNRPQCSHSQPHEINPWWAVDLGRPTTVYKVILTNRASAAWGRPM